MNPRQQAILKLVIDEYIRSAEPVGSKFLSESPGLDVSPATVRNDMAVLEEEGFLRQPHTSAGRVPTEQAFFYYLRHFVHSERPSSSQKTLKNALREEDQERSVKALAKAMAEISGETAIVAFDPEWSYYAGVANLFQKPEFANLELVQSLSAMLDRFDEVVGEMFDAVSREPQVLIGRENPFGENMSAIVVKYRLSPTHFGIIGLVGPTRMNYAKNLGIIEEVKDLLDQNDV